MTTTADMYAGAVGEPATTAPSPDLMELFRSQVATTGVEIWFLWASADEKPHAQWMRELAQLSRDAGSLDRESEIDIWRFDTSE